MLDLKHEFFKPLWVRIATTAVAGGWSIFEFVTGTPFWGIIFGALAVWCGWVFFNGDFEVDSNKQE